MPKARLPENKGLPTRWRRKHGAFYYQVPPGLEHLWDEKKLFRLGKTLPESYKCWADRLVSVDKVRTLGQLLERYALEVIPGKAVTTQHDNFKYIAKLLLVFGEHTPITSLEPSHAYAYYNKSSAKVLAKRELALLFHAYSMAVEWDCIKLNPFKGQVRLKGNNVRVRYVEDWEIVECLSLAPKRKNDSILQIQAYIRLKLLTGMSKGDLLRLRTDINLKEDGIHIMRGKTAKKTGKRTIYLWTDELRQAVQNSIDIRLVKNTPLLFCTRRGECYFDDTTQKSTGWNSIWQRFMLRLITEEKISERFTDHDIRAKTGSDATSIEQASALLSHADTKITQRVYRRKPESVTPNSIARFG